MAFDSNGWQSLTGYGKEAPNIYSYKNTVDSLVTIKVSAYFDEYVGELLVDDIIFVVGSDDYQQLRVTAVSPNVTVEDYQIASVEPNSLNGIQALNVVNLPTSGGLTLTFPVDTAGGPSTNYDMVMDRKITVTDVFVINLTGGTAGDSVTVNNGTMAFTNVIPVSGGGNSTDRMNLYASSNATIDVGQTLRVAQVDGGGSDSPQLRVLINAIPVV